MRLEKLTYKTLASEYPITCIQANDIMKKAGNRWDLATMICDKMLELNVGYDEVIYLISKRRLI